MRSVLVLSGLLLLLSPSFFLDGEWWPGQRRDPGRAQAPPPGPAAGKTTVPRGPTRSSPSAYH